MKRDRGYFVGVDIGGTFTDCAIIDAAGEITTGKVPTTPADLAEGFFASIDAAAAGLGLDAQRVLASGASIFPKEIFKASRRWVELRFKDLRYYNVLDKGGHFAAFE